MSGVLVELGGHPGAGTSAWSAVVAQQPAPPPGTGEEFGRASPVGLVVVLLLGIATAFLIRSMSKRIRRLPASFDRPEESSGTSSADPPADRGAEDAGGGRA